MSTRRIAMWSGPRNISTAMMRAFENRADCAVVDEPFYAVYLADSGLEHPGREEILKSQPRDWRSVAKQLCEDEPAPLFYQKHMTQHIVPSMDLAFTEAFDNCFLIREPRRIIASYAQVRPSFALEELGFIQQQQLFERECERLGHVPPVLDARVTLDDPRGVLATLCEVLDIPFDEGMLAWPPGPRDSDGVWAPHWYSAVWASTGFQAPVAEAPLPPVPSGLERLCEEAESIYRSMREHALSARS